MVTEVLVHSELAPSLLGLWGGRNTIAEGLVETQLASCPLGRREGKSRGGPQRQAPRTFLQDASFSWAPPAVAVPPDDLKPVGLASS